jgi:hypothetical protein
VLGLSWRFYAALQIMDSQFSARECPSYSILLDFLSFVYSIHQVTFDLYSMHRSLITPVLAFCRTFPGEYTLFLLVLLILNLSLQVFDRLLLLRKGGQTVYFGDIGEGAQSIISYFETAGARKCSSEENPYVLYPSSTEISLIINTARNTCLMSSVQEPLPSQIGIGVKYGSILKNAKLWKTKSINFMQKDDHILQLQQLLRPSLQLHGLTKLVPYFNGKTWLFGAILRISCRNLV